MSKSKIDKMTYDELFKTTTMFYVNDDCEKEIERLIEAQTTDIYSGLSVITSKETLAQYICNNSNSLDYLTSIVGISIERFKRIVSMIRKSKGFVFSTEWGTSVIRNKMLETPTLMESVIDLLWDGKNDARYQNLIPAFYLENMCLKDNSLSTIQDKDTVRRLVKHSLEGTYSNMIGDAILSDVRKEIERVCAKYGLEYQQNVRIPRLDRAVSFVLESPSNPKIIIDVSYFVTTSSSQGNKKEAARNTEAIIKKEREQGNNIIYINFLDGAGWIGRQADLREIHRCSDYVLNLNNLHRFESIVDAYIEEL